MARQTRFEWANRKAELNRRKHGIRFETAALVFDDRYIRTEASGDEHGEIRWRSAGEVRGSLIIVTHTTREEDEIEVIRIISARRATRRERSDYEENS